jgi:hypothetical protein
MRSRNKPRAGEPQAQSEKSPVSGHRARQLWQEELCKLSKSLTPLELCIAMRLSLYFNCKTGQCNPGYDKLAKAVGCTERSAQRTCKILEDAGLIRREKTTGGNQDNTTQFHLLVPNERVSNTDTPTGVQADGCPKQGGTGDSNEGVRVSNADALMNNERTFKRTMSRAERRGREDARSAVDVIKGMKGWEMKQANKLFDNLTGNDPASQRERMNEAMERWKEEAEERENIPIHEMELTHAEWMRQWWKEHPEGGVAEAKKAVQGAIADGTLIPTHGGRYRHTPVKWH